jgi:protein-S-isoprenylcysteine O-methyltransferase Ste14
MSGSSWFVVLFLAGVFGERLVATFAHRQLVAGEQRQRWTLYALYTLYTVIVGGSLVEYILTHRPLIKLVSALGLILYVGGVLLRTVAIRTLGKFWSLQIEIRTRHQLIREGIYQYLRHPNYAGIILEVLSIPLVVNAWYILALAGLAYVPMLLYRWRCEEQALVEKFGEEYRAYQREVGALWPKFARRGKTAPIS